MIDCGASLSVDGKVYRNTCLINSLTISYLLKQVELNDTRDARVQSELLDQFRYWSGMLVSASHHDSINMLDFDDHIESIRFVLETMGVGQLEVFACSRKDANDACLVRTVDVYGAGGGRRLRICLSLTGYHWYALPDFDRLSPEQELEKVETVAKLVRTGL